MERGRLEGRQGSVSASGPERGLLPHRCYFLKDAAAGRGRKRQAGGVEGKVKGVKWPFGNVGKRTHWDCSNVHRAESCPFLPCHESEREVARCIWPRDANSWE